jgi:ATP-dependent DNA helicase RecG
LADTTAENKNPLETPVQFLKGVGPSRAALMYRLGLRTAEDVLFFLPRDILDMTEVCPVQRLEADVLQSVNGNVVDVDGRELSGGRNMTAVLLDCEGHYVRGTWFNQPWMLKKFVNGQSVLFSGKPKRRGGRWEIANPKVQYLDNDDEGIAGQLQPLYRLTEGLKMHHIRRVIHNAVRQFVSYLSDPLPVELRAEIDVIELQSAIRQLHMPATKEEYEAARRRVIYDDMLDFQLGMGLRRRVWKQKQKAPVLETTARIDARIRRLFPFRFTAGQDLAIADVCQDMQSGKAMHRLLQADVGAGKTAIAIYAMLVAIAAGHQAVLMAPTEVLANQHWSTINEILINSRVVRASLTGNLTAAQRRDTLAGIQDGRIQLVVGTQAVIQKTVSFSRLALAVVDEQHKFGVMQRANFTSNDGLQPHVLVMTATPIPRSLCLTQFGDLDLSVISELPPGRQKIVTGRVSNETQRTKSWEFIRKQLSSGRQAYVVCPRVEEREDETEEQLSASAEAVYRQLQSSELADFNIRLVHGRMDKDAKAAAMDAFREGDAQVLVSTTVIEVGIDVANATIMAIIQAERFGLSQLHQLRGRIGRGRYQSYCFLFSDSETPEANTRLEALEKTTDGFKLAEVDFELRGPGNVLGTDQSGQLPLRVANPLRDHQILKESRLAAFGLIESERLDTPEFAALKNRVLNRFAKLMDLPRSG